MRSSFASQLAALFVLAVPSLAAASPTFPFAIKSDLSLSYDLGTDHCTICHATNLGGLGTVVTPFGEAMQAAGLVAEDTTSLQKALDTLEANGTDSDHNGVPDIEELKAGEDPNTGQDISGATGTSGPSFGCGAQLSRAPAPWEGAAALLATLGAMLVRRRRSRAARPS